MTVHANLVRNDCFSHTLHNSGGEMTKDSCAKYCDDFRKKYQSLIRKSKCFNSINEIQIDHF